MKTYIVEHLDPELGAWSALEYQTIAQECANHNARFCLSFAGRPVDCPEDVRSAPGMHIEARPVEEAFASQKNRICLLDPAAAQDLGPADAQNFDVFLFGGILGDDPPRDRTSELRKKGYQGRRLGSRQMTTDTAARVTRMVIQDQVTLDAIAYVDNPELRIDAHESTEMPFRYVKSPNGQPVMPPGMLELIKKDSEKGFGELLADATPASS